MIKGTAKSLIIHNSKLSNAIAKNSDKDTLPNTSTQRSKIVTLNTLVSTLRTTTPEANAQTKVGITKLDSLKCSAIKLDK